MLIKSFQIESKLIGYPLSAKCISTQTPKNPISDEKSIEIGALGKTQVLANIIIPESAHSLSRLLIWLGRQSGHDEVWAIRTRLLIQGPSWQKYVKMNQTYLI